MIMILHGGNKNRKEANVSGGNKKKRTRNERQEGAWS